MRQNKNDFSRVIDVGHGITLAADLPVARPVDQNLPPVRRLAARQVTKSLGAENWENSSPFSLTTRSELLLALSNHFRALLLRQRQHRLGPFGQLFVDQRMGAGQLLLNLTRLE